MKTIITSILIFITSAVIAQIGDSLNLKSCYDEAIKNYPLIKQKDMLSASSELKIKNIKTNYLPQINLNGQATYQSDVTSIPIKLPNLKLSELSKDQYKIYVDLSQTIYDGGLTNKQKSYEDISLQTDQQNIEVEVNKIKAYINQIYFNILILQDNEKIVKIFKDEINSKLKMLESSVRNGVTLQSNLDLLKAERIKFDQQEIEIEMNKVAAFKMLGDYMNRTFSDSIKLAIPLYEASPTQPENQRLEMKLFDLQAQKVEASKGLLNSKLLPHISAFGQAGYGRPGFNMLSNDFNTFYILGARLNWNLWDWHHTKNEKNLLDIQSQIINNQKENFDKNLKIAEEKDIAEIHKFELLISKDNEIVALQRSATLNTASQMINGVVTVTDYISTMRSEMQAKINMEIHKIQLYQAKVNYLNNAGKL